MSIWRWNGDDRDLACTLVEYRHVHRVSVAPKAQERPISASQLTCGETPAVLVHHQPRPRTMSRDFPAFDGVEQRGHRFLSQELRHVLKPSDQHRRHVNSCYEYECEMREHRHIGGLGLR